MHGISTTAGCSQWRSAGRSTTAGQADLLTSNLALTTRDLVDLATQANNNDAFLKQRVVSVVELLGVEVQKPGTDRAKDIDALTKALEARVRIMRCELATLRAEVTKLGARPSPAGLEQAGVASLAQLQELER